MPGHKGAPQVISTMGSRRGFTYMPGHTGGAPLVVGVREKNVSCVNACDIFLVGNDTHNRHHGKASKCKFKSESTVYGSHHVPMHVIYPIFLKKCILVKSL